MVTSKQIRRLATNPAALIKFQSSGRLPQSIRPTSPLIDLLVALNPRDRMSIVGLTVDSGLGYQGSRQFQTAEQALRWIRPDTEMLEGESWPAESWRIKAFRGPLHIEDVIERASAVPQALQERYPRLRRRPRSSTLEGTNLMPDPAKELMLLLSRHQLDVTNNRIEHEGFGTVRFSGNFHGHSHAFQFRSADPETVTLVCKAIFANRQRADYVADVKYREDAAQEYHAGLEMTGNAEAIREAHVEWAAMRPTKGDRILGAPLPEALRSSIFGSDSANDAPSPASYQIPRG